ncbi:MAG: Bug family tripartite tricarboxylate transporter substrate binding protein [Burkholderiales bacterium]
MHKTAFTHMLAIALGAVLAASAFAQSWPARPVRIIAPFPPGGGTDMVGRLLAQKFTEQIGGTFIVENRPGGAGMLGAELTAKAPADGYTLLVSAPEFTINPAVRAKLPYDPLKDFAFISQLTAGQFILAGHPSVPVRNVKELIALAKAKPGELNYGSSGTGGINHLIGELLQSMTGIRWVHVPFKGAGPAVVGLMSGEVGFAFAGTTGLVGPIKSSKVRGIAVTGSTRFSELPDVPTVAESGVPGFNVSGWYGFYAPAGTPQDIVRRLQGEARRALTSPDAKEKLQKTGNEPVVSTPEEFGAFIRNEIAMWTKVVKNAKIRVD